MKAIIAAGAALLSFVLLSSPALCQSPKPTEAKKDPSKTDAPKTDDPKQALSLTGEVPPAIAKPLPESIADLKTIQEQTRKVVDKVMPAVVGISIKGAFGSGVIVSRDGIVLTAGHVSGKPGTECDIILHDGKKLKGKSLGREPGIDSGMFQITTPGKYDFCEMGKSDKLKQGQWCIAIGHPNGVEVHKGRPPVVRLGRILEVDQKKIRTDCTLVGGDSGGPLFDMQGKVIGIHSRIDFMISSNIHVPVNTYTNNWDKLVKGETIGGSPIVPTLTGDRPYLGVVRDDDAKDCRLGLITEGSPAQRAGLKAGDTITKFDGKDVKSYDDLLGLLSAKKAGDEVDILVKRGSDTKTFKIRLETRDGKAGTPYLGVVQDEGSPSCKLLRVTEESPAQKAGLKPGDVITKFDGKNVDSFVQLLSQLGDKKPGDEVNVTVKRGDETMSLRVKLGRKG
jgi:serine protease Do